MNTTDMLGFLDINLYLEKNILGLFNGTVYRNKYTLIDLSRNSVVC